MKYLNEKEIKRKSLEILVCFAEYCENNNLKYSLAYGTLLGAIRHNGFIPWDDDIDVAMPREDYEKFIKLSQINSINEKYDVLHFKLNPEYLLPFAKITDNTTMGYEWARGKGMQNGVWIDIFPFDYVPDNEIERADFFYKVDREKVNIVVRSLPFKFNKNLIILSKNIVKFIIYSCTSKSSLLKRISAFDELAYSNDKAQSNLMTVIESLDVGDSAKGIISYDDLFNNMIKVEFEGELFNVPKTYDKWLTNIYGNYMELPKECERIAHSSEIWHVENKIK